jgi:zinc protease
MIDNNTIYYQQDGRVPMTAFSIVFRGGGYQQEQEHQTGLAKLTAKTLLRGTPARTREAIAKTFELWGASVEAYVNETDFVIAASCFSRNLTSVIGLLKEILETADFPEAELDLAKKQEANKLEAALQDPETVLSAANEYMLFGKTEFGKMGSRKALDGLTRADVRVFFSRVRTSDCVHVTVISDLTRAQVESELAPILKSRARDGFKLLPERLHDGSRGLTAAIFNSPGATNDRFMWSHRGIGATDDRRFDLNLIVDALGSFEGFLFDQLRNQRGWCYGAYAYILPATTRPGRIGYYADPASDTADKLVPEFLRLLGLFSSHEDFRTRLSGRNETFKNRYAYQLDIRKKLSNEVNRDSYGIPILDKEAYNTRIDNVTQETATRVIKEVFDPGNMTMVFYGDAERLGRILAGIRSPVTVTMHEKEELVA